MLNCLGEADAEPTMKHFLKRFGAGADRFQVRATQSYLVFIGSACVLLYCMVLYCTDATRWHVGKVARPAAAVSPAGSSNSQSVCRSCDTHLAPVFILTTAAPCVGDGMQGIDWFPAEHNKCPVLSNAIAYMECT